MKISIIIPTHNRSTLLQNVMESILVLKGEAEYELVIVDNNSNDNTKAVVESYGNIARYVFEKRTAFTRARRTGEENATGDILLYLDDDVIVNSGSLKKIVEIFKTYPECGVIAGKILPKFSSPPPQWVLECQNAFNGWSLYNEDTFDFIKRDLQIVQYAAGPMMAIRRNVYKLIDGFPPDTIGVETNRGNKSFNKLYIGPGDYGFCIKARQAGYKVYYSDKVSVYHIIPPVRFTLSFWRSRMIGEGYYTAIAQREFFKFSGIKSMVRRFNFHIFYHQYKHRLVKKISTLGTDKNAPPLVDGMFPEELWVHFYKAYLDMDWVLRRYQDLSPFLWGIGYDGVDDNNFDDVMKRLPKEYKNLVNNDLVYNSSPINSIRTLDEIVENRGYYNVKSNRLLKTYSMLLPDIELRMNMKSFARRIIY